MVKGLRGENGGCVITTYIEKAENPAGAGVERQPGAKALSIQGECVYVTCGGCVLEVCA